MEVDDAAIPSSVSSSSNNLDQSRSRRHKTKYSPANDNILLDTVSHHENHERCSPEAIDMLVDSSAHPTTCLPKKSQKMTKKTRTTSLKRNSDSADSDLPLKLRLTSDEDASDFDAFHSDEALSLKRKRSDLRRSGSQECLLGFDEESGEAELVKDEGQMDLSENTDSPNVSPKQSKRLKKSPASGKSSPRVTATVAAKNDSTAKSVAEKAIKAHVVGDNEENGEPQLDMQSSNVNSSSSSKKSLVNPKASYYFKPFELGWKRELVWRANMESNKEKADVYYIAPSGKKLRSRSEIAPYIGTDLSIEQFFFIREPLGLGPEYETVRSAKISNRQTVAAATLAAAPAPGSIGKRISKPKGPKGASPPPEGWTPTRALKVNNAALHSSSNSSSKQNSSTSNAHPSTPSRHHASANASRDNSSTSKTSGGSSRSKKHSTASSVEANKIHDTKSSQSQNNIVSASAATAASSTSPPTHEPCTYNCPQANGKLPQLQCTKCLCLYHNECVGGNQPGSAYICEACQPKPNAAATTTASAPITSSAIPRSPATSSTNTRNVNVTRNTRTDGKAAQTIAVVKGKKYVMVSKPNAAPSASQNANDIENDLRQIKEGIQHTNRNTSTGPNAEAAVAAVERSNKLFAANFFANVSYAYDALVCILKYLKIHERSRAASVCKLWHLAAKDTSLWQTVRMKNSKVCDWAGFAAALRRGETKHLDLRKMLHSSGQSEELWHAFSDHIGTVCSLEVIDLCRCSVRVVESLFESNRRLRVLNAIAINDDAINLENIGLMTELEELRLRTLEPSIIVGDLQPLRALTKLTHLSLTSVRGLGTRGITVLSELTTLRSLELGECGDFEPIFAEFVLPQLTNLNRLRLENGTETACCTLGILEAVSQLTQLTQLELVNFDIKPGFDEKLYKCSNIRKLLIIPTYISQSATTNHIVLSAVQQIAESLQVFTWGVTVELLRVTALYVDQCDDSIKKEKHHFDECIPVLKPVPGAPIAEEDDAQPVTSDVPQIEILPLEKVETILGENLPGTKFTIVKVPYIATSKQQLVE